MNGRRYYIAYGSNLSVEQMKARCPYARPAGMAALPDWKLVFRTHATIEPCKGRVVPVLIWEITEKDEKNLDQYEGWPTYYRKEELTLTMTNFQGLNARKITGMVYIMNDGHDPMMPMKGYYDVLEQAYERFKFNKYQLVLAMREAREAMERELS